MNTDMLLFLVFAMGFAWGFIARYNEDESGNMIKIAWRKVQTWNRQK